MASFFVKFLLIVAITFNAASSTAKAPEIQLRDRIINAPYSHYETENKGTQLYGDIQGITPQYFQESLQELLKMNKTTNLISTEEFDAMMDSLLIGQIHEPTMDPNGHPDHTHDKSYNDQHLRVDDHDLDHLNEESCFSPYELLEIYGIDTENFNATTLTYENITNMLPAIIQQQLSKACIHDHSNMTQKNEKPTIAERYGYGTLATIAISIAPFLFVFAIPSTKHQSYRYVMNALIALSASTLIGDALLHLLPQALKLHGDHGAAGHAHDVDEPLEVPDYVLKEVVVMGALYVFYLFEMIVNGPHHANQVEEGHGHGHSHMPDFGSIKKSKDEHHHHEHHHHHQTSVEEEHKKKTTGEDQAEMTEFADNSAPAMLQKPLDRVSKVSECEGQDVLTEINMPRSRAATLTFDVDHQVFRERLPTGSSMRKQRQALQHQQSTGRNRGNSTTAHPPQLPTVASVPTISVVDESTSAKVEVQEEKHEDEGCWKSFLHELVPNKTLGWMVIFGDAIHNVIDGIAIGAAFSGDLVSGLSTSIAIVCHEVPHEVGDFAALLASGVSWRGGVFWNILFSFLSIGGLYIGISLGDDDSARLWVFALTSGMFLYVALTEMMPELTRVRGQFWTYFAFQNLGLLVGFAIMFVIAVFEEKLAIVMAGSLS